MAFYPQNGIPAGASGSGQLIICGFLCSVLCCGYACGWWQPCPWKNYRTLHCLSNNYGLFAAINKQAGVSCKFCRAEDSKSLPMGAPWTTVACIMESPLSQLRETLEQRTTVSKCSSLVSIQHTSFWECTQSSLYQPWVRRHPVYICQQLRILLLSTFAMGY